MSEQDLMQTLIESEGKVSFGKLTEGRTKFDMGPATEYDKRIAQNQIRSAKKRVERFNTEFEQFGLSVDNVVGDVGEQDNDVYVTLSNGDELSYQSTFDGATMYYNRAPEKKILGYIQGVGGDIVSGLLNFYKREVVEPKLRNALK